MSATVLRALDAELARDGARPLVTFYDGATGERIELSVRTFDNWVCKVANLLGDELMLEARGAIAVDLPAHWQSAVVVAGAWAAGLRVIEDAHAADVLVVGPHRERDPAPGVAVLAVSLRPLGGPFAEPIPKSWLDFAREVPPQPDSLLVDADVGAGDPAIETSSGSVSHAELVRAGLDAADLLGLTAGGRLLTDLNPARADELVAALVAPIVAGAAVVIVVNVTGEQRASIAAQEGVTATCWRGGDA
jgi:uncharacterized protein (TIGR03089 family)